tara:strand:- start:48 stop:173 length:126 start_codon:yes stop_codon:yes gene_type:complete
MSIAILKPKQKNKSGLIGGVRYIVVAPDYAVRLVKLVWLVK